MMLRRFLAFVFSFALLVPTIGLADELQISNSEIDNIISQEKDFSGVVLVSVDGEIEFHKAYGWADRELVVPLEKDGVFRIASVSKVFTAIAIMQLRDQGRLNLSDPIGTYLSWYPSPAAETVTIEQLLMHRSGIPDFLPMGDFWDNRAVEISPADLVSVFKDEPLQFTPGEKYAYSNSGYVVLGLIVEAVSGMTLEAYLQEHIFVPAEMATAGVDNSVNVVENQVAGYSLVRQEHPVKAHYIHMSRAYAAGGIYSSATDLWAFNEAFLRGDLLKIESVAEMTHHPGPFGYGWIVSHDTLPKGEPKLDNFGRCHMWHDGVIDGYTAILSSYGMDRVTIIILSNNDYGFSGAEKLHDLHNEVGRTIFETP